MVAGFEVLDREAPPTLELGRRTGIAEVETGYGSREAWPQAARCLVCHVQTIYDPEKCVLCSRCVDVCPEYCLAIVPFEELDLPEDEKARARGAGRGERPAPLRDDQGRRPLHPLRPLRRPLPHRRHDHGEVPDHREVRAGRSLDSPARREGMAEDKNDSPRFPDEAGARRRRGRPRHPGRGLAALPRPQRLLRRAHHGEGRDAPEFPDGLKFLPDQRLFVFRQGKIFHAISAVCTHLGCTVRAEALSQPEEQDGGRRAAPADPSLPLPLPRVEVRRRRQQRVGPGAAAPRLVPPRGRHRRRAARRGSGARGRRATSASRSPEERHEHSREAARRRTDSPRRPPEGALEPRPALGPRVGRRGRLELPAPLVPGQGLQAVARLDLLLLARHHHVGAAACCCPLGPAPPLPLRAFGGAGLRAR